jgi:hypothetical protein
MHLHIVSILRRLAPGVGLAFALATAASGSRVLWGLPAGGVLVLLYWVALAAGVALASRRSGARWLSPASARLSHPIALGAVVLALCAFNAVFFQWNNSLKAVGRDSTGDDAIIEAFRSFAAGLPMYDARLYDGAPISPGPLWVLLNGWLATLGAHFLMTPLYLVAVLFLLEQGERAGFLALALCNPLVWTTSGTGHDHVAIGLAFLGCLLWARRAGPGVAHVLGLVVAGAILGTSRIVYVGFPILLALCAERLSPRARWCVGGLGTALALGTHAGFMAQAARYQPAHLLDRGLRNVGVPLMIIGAAGALLVLAFAWRRAAARFASPVCFASALLVPHAAIALGELLSVHGRVAVWEGANYLLPALPALAYAWLRAAPLSSAAAPASVANMPCPALAGRP